MLLYCMFILLFIRNVCISEVLVLVSSAGLGAGSIVLYACCSLNRSGLSNAVSSRKFEVSAVSIAMVGICVLAQLALILVLGDIYHTGTGIIDVMALQWYWNINGYDQTLSTTMLLSDTLALTTSLCLLSRSSSYVMLVLIGVDVIHSFAMPALGIKMDCIPARVLSLMMFSEMVGTYYGQCSELCGALHSFMPVSCVFI